MSVESFRNPASPPAFQPSGCPRCAVKLERPYKYCPNCSYRLRPDLARHHPTGAEPVGQAQRLLALGGYLGFVSLLLLLVLVGLRLFESNAAAPEEPLRRIKIAVKSVHFGPADLLEVSGGEVSWGVYRPVDSTSVTSELLRTMPTLALDDSDPAISEVAEWLDRTRAVIEEQARALLPDLYRVDDPFLIGVAEITNEQWYTFLHARAEKSGAPAPGEYYPRSWTRSSPNRLVPRLYPAAASGNPVSDISCAAALEFCNWVWEEVLGADPDTLVDLPTALEFARAGRGSSLDNFPWGRRFSDRTEQELVNLSGRALPVAENEVGLYRGLYAQVGNVSEWIHFQNGSAAAGWSYLESARLYAIDRGDWTSPFSSDELEQYTELSARAPDLGFRIVVRRAPSLPRFVAVAAGPVRFVTRDNPVKPPIVQEFDAATGEFSQVQLPPVKMPTETLSIAHDFEIAVNEVTNRQYLAFLVEEAPKLTDGITPTDTDMEREAKAKELNEKRHALLPVSFRFRDHPFRGSDFIYTGPFGDGNAIPKLFEPGIETRPVHGVTPTQAQAYARWLGQKLGAPVRLPTAAEYVRAGRGDGTSPYPWGASDGKPELICEGRADDQDRARSLYPFLEDDPDSILGLCGNVLELVEAPAGVVTRRRGELAAPKRDWLLAGGAYEFVADACTLDSFLEQRWNEAEVPRDLDPTGDGTQDELDRIQLLPLTGFRVVRERQK